MKNKIYILNFILLLFIFAFAGPLLAIDYYVDQNHPSASDNNPGISIKPWKTITKANQTLIAGDTAYIKTGVYTNYIAPQNSGISDNSRITYKNYDSDVVTIQNASHGIHLNGNDYITVQGIGFSNNNQQMILENGADYNIIDGCTFDGDDGTTPWAGSRIWVNSTYNIVRNNTFSNYGSNTGIQPNGSDNGTLLDIGNENTTTDNSDYNLIEDNIFFGAGHHILGVNSRFNTVRNNYMHNEAWDNGHGNRTLYLGGWAASSGRNLIENNRMGYAAEPVDAYGVSGALVGTKYNIIRYNSFYHNNLSGMELACYDSDSSYNLIYNNTFFNNAYDPDRGYYPANGRYFGAITLSDWNAGVVTENNVIKNNLYYSHTYDTNVPVGVNGAVLGHQTIENNYDGDVSGDPLFTNASTTLPVDKTDSTLPNLNLQSGSPAIDIGGPLTTVLSGCSGATTQIVLDDASYFHDGTWGLSIEVDADWIAIGTVGNTVQISSISINTVNLVSAISCNNGDNIWLYKDSDGTIVLSGIAPDAGAYEYGIGTQKRPLPPQNLRIVNTGSP